MKKLALLTVLCSLSVAVHSADWTPVFEGNSSILGKIFEISYSKSGTGLSESALFGDYKAIPMPYRADMLPAEFKVETTEDNDRVVELTIPLDNATLYGLPIRKISNGHIPDTDAAFTYVTFHPMTNAQYQKLKRQDFSIEQDEDDPCGGGAATVIKNDKGEVVLSYDIGC